MPKPLTEFELEVWKQKISHLTLEECARLYRFAPQGHPVFNVELPLYSLFSTRYTALGGLNSELSHKIGWTEGSKGIPTIEGRSS